MAGSQKKGRFSEGALDLTSGITAGFCVKFVEYPFDTVKVLQQTMGARYKGPVDCILTTYRGGGVGALYKGLASPLVGSMAECACLFVSYGYMKRVLNVDEKKATLADPVPMWKYYVSGAFSGLFSSFVLTPVELVKCRLQVQAGAQAAAVGSGVAAELATTSYRGPMDCVTRIVREEGVAGLWRGNVSCLVREVPGNMAWFGAYELVIRGVQMSLGYQLKGDVPLPWCALAGAVAGVCYWAVPFPADTVKSKLQTDPRFEGKSFVNAFRAILQESGVRGLYRGVGITCLRAAPAHGLLFFVREAVTNELERI